MKWFLKYFSQEEAELKQIVSTIDATGFAQATVGHDANFSLSQQKSQQEAIQRERDQKASVRSPTQFHSVDPDHARNIHHTLFCSSNVFVNKFKMLETPRRRPGWKN
jgi:hypothetical protein